MAYVKDDFHIYFRKRQVFSGSSILEDNAAIHVFELGTFLAPQPPGSPNLLALDRALKALSAQKDVPLPDPPLLLVLFTL